MPGDSRYTSTGAAVNSWPAELGAEPRGPGGWSWLIPSLARVWGGGDEGGEREGKNVGKKIEEKYSDKQILG